MVALAVQNCLPTQEKEEPPEEGTATRSSVPAWKILRAEEGSIHGVAKESDTAATKQQQRIHTRERWVPGQTKALDLLTNYGLNTDNEGVAKPFSKTGNRKYTGGERQLWVRSSAQVRLRTSQLPSGQPAACPSPALTSFPSTFHTTFNLLFWERLQRIFLAERALKDNDDDKTMTEVISEITLTTTVTTILTSSERTFHARHRLLCFTRILINERCSITISTLKMRRLWIGEAE